MRAIGALVAVIVSGTVAGSSPAWADNTVDTSKQADDLFLAGRDAVAKGDFKAACDKFFEAQKIQPRNVAILLNLGQCNEKQGKFGSALKWYRRTVNSATENTKNDPALQEYVATAGERAGALDAVAAKITFDLSLLQPGALATIDGETILSTELAVSVDKGTRILEVRLAGKKTSHEEIKVEDGQQLTHKFQPLEDAPIVGNRRRRRLMGALIGGGVILVASAATGLWANSIQADFDKAVADGKDQETKDKIADKMLPPTLVWVGGVAVGLGIAAYFFFTAPPGERQEEALPKTAFTPTVSGDSVGFSMLRRF